MSTDYGVLIVESDEADFKTHLAMNRCVHCDHRWIVIKGSGRKRGYCQTCAGPTCGRPSCVAQQIIRHAPAEFFLDVASGVQNPTAVSVGVIQQIGK